MGNEFHAILKTLLRVKTRMTLVSVGDIGRLVEFIRLEQLVKDLQEELVSKNAEIDHLKAQLSKRKHVYTHISEVPIQVLLKMRNPETSDEKLNRVWAAINKWNTLNPNCKVNPTAKIMTRIVMVEDKKIREWMEFHHEMVTQYQNLHQLNEDGRNTWNMRYNHKDHKGQTRLAEIIKEIKTNILV